MADMDELNPFEEQHKKRMEVLRADIRRRKTDVDEIRPSYTPRQVGRVDSAMVVQNLSELLDQANALEIIDTATIKTRRSDAKSVRQNMMAKFAAESVVQIPGEKLGVQPDKKEEGSSRAQVQKEDCDLSGEMLREVSGRMKPYRFYLKGSVLEYHSDTERASGSVGLGECTFVKPKRKGNFVIALQHPRTVYTLQAPGEASFKDWVTKMSLHTKINPKFNPLEDAEKTQMSRGGSRFGTLRRKPTDSPKAPAAPPLPPSDFSKAVFGTQEDAASSPKRADDSDLCDMVGFLFKSEGVLAKKEEYFFRLRGNFFSYAETTVDASSGDPVTASYSYDLEDYDVLQKAKAKKPTFVLQHVLSRKVITFQAAEQAELETWLYALRKSKDKNYTHVPAPEAPPAIKGKLPSLGEAAPPPPPPKPKVFCWNAEEGAPIAADITCEEEQEERVEPAGVVVEADDDEESEEESSEEEEEEVVEEPRDSVPEELMVLVGPGAPPPVDESDARADDEAGMPPPPDVLAPPLVKMQPPLPLDVARPPRASASELSEAGDLVDAAMASMGGQEVLLAPPPPPPRMSKRSAMEELMEKYPGVTRRDLDEAAAMLKRASETGRLRKDQPGRERRLMDLFLQQRSKEREAAADCRSRSQRMRPLQPPAEPAPTRQQLSQQQPLAQPQQRPLRKQQSGSRIQAHCRLRDKNGPPIYVSLSKSEDTLTIYKYLRSGREMTLNTNDPNCLAGVLPLRDFIVSLKVLYHTIILVPLMKSATPGMELFFDQENEFNMWRNAIHGSSAMGGPWFRTGELVISAGGGSGRRFIITIADEILYWRPPGELEQNVGSLSLVSSWLKYVPGQRNSSGLFFFALLGDADLYFCSESEEVIRDWVTAIAKNQLRLRQGSA